MAKKKQKQKTERGQVVFECISCLSSRSSFWPFSFELTVLKKKPLSRSNVAGQRAGGAPSSFSKMDQWKKLRDASNEVLLPSQIIAIEKPSIFIFSYERMRKHFLVDQFPAEGYLYIYIYIYSFVQGTPIPYSTLRIRRLYFYML